MRFPPLFAFVLVPALALAAAPALAADDEGVGALVDRVVASYGGESALSQAAVMRQSGRTVAFMRDATAAMTRTFERPDRLRVELAYPERGTEIRILDGAQAWRQERPVSGPMHGAMTLQAARINLPALLRDERERLVDGGWATAADGTRVRLLRLPLSEKLALRVEIEPERARILRSTGTIFMGEHGAMEFTTEYSEFRSWEGVLVAAREEQYAMGQHIGYTVIEAVEFPGALDPETFRP